MNREELANDIWRACDIMRRDDGTTGVMEYVEQLSWLLFLKVFEAIEDRYETEAALGKTSHSRILTGDYRWSKWATKDWPGKQLVEFVDEKLFPLLRGLSGSPEKDIIAHIFQEIPGNRMKSPYNLKDVIAIIDKIDFQNADDIHTVSHIYEDLLRRMGSENRMAGEFYTPRPIVRFMVELVDPKIGETVYDPGCGSAGFLVESYLRMKKDEKSTEDHETLQRHTFYGQEKKPLPCLLGMMNMILHGVLTPNIVRKNTLGDNIRNISDEHRHRVILTNPPFGGKENRQIQQNFPVKGQATELLFLQHIMKKLKPGGRCGMVVPEGTLFRGEAFATVKKELLDNFNLHTIVSLPPGVFLPYSGVKTNLIFFERTGPTKDIWYYDLQPPPGIQKFTKGKPVQDEHFDDCRTKWKTREVSDQSWTVSAGEIVENGYDLTAKNPSRKAETELPPPEELVADILEKEHRITQILEELRTLLKRKP